MPLNIYYAWILPLSDNVFQDAIRQSAARIRYAAVAEDQALSQDAPVYPNYAIFDTPLSQLYGGNLPFLKSVKAIVDPNNVMGLAGGFKIEV